MLPVSQSLDYNERPGSYRAPGHCNELSGSTRQELTMLNEMSLPRDMIGQPGRWLKRIFADINRPGNILVTRNCRGYPVVRGDSGE